MADEQPRSSSGSSKRRRRRRSSGKRSRTNKPRSNDAPSAQGNRSGADKDSGGTSRRRRRSRSRSRGGQTRDAATKADPLDAKLPESIFVYTHVLRSSELDTYGFRPDPFLNHSRSLDDFRVDLSPLFPESAGPEERVFDSALHGPIVTSVADSLDDEDGYDGEHENGHENEHDGLDEEA